MMFKPRHFINSFMSKKWFAISSTIMFFLSCSEIISAVKATEIERIYSRFNLQEILRLDTENKSLIDKGLLDIYRFTVDNEGNIYILYKRNQGDMIFMLDQRGRILRSFGRKGQGPGELENPEEILLSPEGNLFVQDIGNGKLTIFNKEGTFIELKRLSPEITLVSSLSNGNFLGLEPIYGGDVNQWGLTLNYYDANFKKIRELDRLTFPNPVASKIIEASPHVIICRVSGDRIYSAYPERGYEFLVFDLKGEFIRKISVKAKSRNSMELYKKIIERDYGDLIKFGVKLNYPKSALPFYSYFTDENGYLFVMTYEPGKKPGEYMYDVISPEGKLVNKVSLGPYFSAGNILAKVLGNHLYLVREKESGEKELVVYKIY